MPDPRKSTEDLLAGFDRTGRTPRAPPVRPPDLRRDMVTVAVRPTSNRALWPWLAIGAVFALTIVTVVLLALPPARAPVAAPPAAPPPTVVDTAPVVASEAVVSVQPPAPPPPPPHSAAPAVSATPKPKDDQRVDFVRNL